MKKILILNGPNLNLLGKRQPEIYGSQCFEEYFETLESQFENQNLQLYYFQSNHEGTLLDKLHEVGFSWDGIIFNAGGYTHTSIALAAAIYFGGHISGGNYNPGVSLMMFLTNKLSQMEFLQYVLVQALAAISAVQFSKLAK